MLKFVGRLYKKAKENQKGFTLMELMIVVIIIGILAAVIVPRFARVNQDSVKANTETTNVRLLQSAVERYYQDKGSYPSVLGDLKTQGYVDEIPNKSDGTTPFDYSSATGTVSK